MPVTGMNHAVLYVRDVAASVAFYREALDFKVVHHLPGKAAFLQAPGSTNDHDLGLFQLGAGAAPSTAGRTSVGLYHLAWEVDTLAEMVRLAEVLTAHHALVGATDHTTTKALYARDPDGLEFELTWQVPLDRLSDDDRAALSRGVPPNRPLDLDAEIARFGPDTPSGP